MKAAVVNNNAPVVAQSNTPFFGKEGNKPFFSNTRGGIPAIQQKATPFIQKQDDTATGTTAPAAAPTPTATTTGSTRAEHNNWNKQVDDLVRSTYNLRGAAARTRINYRASASFGSALPAPGKEEIILNILYSAGNNITVSYILRDNHLGLTRSLDRFRAYIAQAISVGYFEHQSHVPGQTGPIRITPDQLIAMFVGGFTSSARSRAARRITIQDIPADVETLVHEVCHFYTNNAFADIANSTANVNRIEHGLRVQQVLIEGFTEYFARKVMRQNAAVLGPLLSQSYESEYYEAMRIISTMGEQDAENAFFRGNTAALARLQRSTDENFSTNPNLLVPDFMIE